MLPLEFAQQLLLAKVDVPGYKLSDAVKEAKELASAFSAVESYGLEIVTYRGDTCIKLGSDAAPMYARMHSPEEAAEFIRALGFTPQTKYKKISE